MAVGEACLIPQTTPHCHDSCPCDALLISSNVAFCTLDCVLLISGASTVGSRQNRHPFLWYVNLARRRKIKCRYATRANPRFLALRLPFQSLEDFIGRNGNLVNAYP